MSAQAQIKALKANLKILDLQCKRAESLMAANLAAQAEIKAQIQAAHSEIEALGQTSAQGIKRRQDITAGALLWQSGYVQQILRRIKKDEAALARLKGEHKEICTLLASAVGKQQVMQKLLAAQIHQQDILIEESRDDQQNLNWLIANKFKG